MILRLNDIFIRDLRYEDKNLGIYLARQWQWQRFFLQWEWMPEKQQRCNYVKIMRISRANYNDTTHLRMNLTTDQTASKKSSSLFFHLPQFLLHIIGEYSRKQNAMFPHILIYFQRNTKSNRIEINKAIQKWT